MALFIFEIELTGQGNLFNAMKAEFQRMPTPFPEMPDEIATVRSLLPPFPTTVSYLKIESDSSFGLIGPYHQSPFYKKIVQAKTDGTTFSMEFYGGNRNTIDLRDINIDGFGTFAIVIQVI